MLRFFESNFPFLHIVPVSNSLHYQSGLISEPCSPLLQCVLSAHQKAVECYPDNSPNQYYSMNWTLWNAIHQPYPKQCGCLIPEKTKENPLIQKHEVDINRVKDLDINVLISGESGTGKELIAKAIHYSSKRKSMPLVSVNCAAIPYNLMESELFGYEKGAFTGANQRMKGKFELANGGTLLLDEIGDMDIGMQAKILRVLEERKIMPLGSETPIPLDIRFLAATNLDLEEEVEKGNFREDLLFRLKVITIEVPSLRDRKEDIPILTQHFLNKYSKEFNKEIQGVLPSAAEALESYDYPGNVRELKNIIQRAVALSNNEFIGVSDLPKELLYNIDIGNSRRDQIPVYIGEKLDDIEKKVILETYEFFQNNKRKTAKTLGISERNLYNKLNEYNVD